MELKRIWNEKLFQLLKELCGEWRWLITELFHWKYVKHVISNLHLSLSREWTSLHSVWFSDKTCCVSSLDKRHRQATIRCHFKRQQLFSAIISDLPTSGWQWINAPKTISPSLAAVSVTQLVSLFTKNSATSEQFAQSTVCSKNPEDLNALQKSNLPRRRHECLRPLKKY